MTKTEIAERITEEIYSLHSRKNTYWYRSHLGASKIGHPCDRFLWLDFRWALPPKIEGRIYRLFNSGQREEERIIEELDELGYEVISADEEGRQVRFSEFGHFGGSVDGIIRGINGSPDEWHILEIKTMNKKNFAELEKHGVEKAQPKHWAQVQTYLRGFNLNKAFYVAVCKDDDKIHIEEITHEPEASRYFFDRAEKIIFGSCPPVEKSDSCKYCDYSSLCFNESQPLKNCRMCKFSQPEPDGSWLCLCINDKINNELMVFGCEKWEDGRISEEVV